MSWHDEHDPLARSLGAELRGALGGADEHFDYDALVAGTKARAGRIRRRRTVARGVAAAVMVPTLVGAGVAINGSLTGGPDAGLPAAQPTDQVTATQDPSEQTTQVLDEPPFQDAAALPGTPPVETNADFPNRWQIPDVRPTGVDFLDAIGAPVSVAAYPRVIPLAGMIATREGVEPHSGAYWTYFDGTNKFEQDTAEITVTGWEDSAAVLAALRADEPVTLARWDGELRTRTWEGHDDADHLMVDLWERPMPTVGALVRQGDYLVGVTVQAGTEQEAARVAAEIAEKTAANLAHLDPEHAQD